MTKTIKLPPLVIDEPTAQLIHRLAKGANVSTLLRSWIREGILASPDLAALNTENLPAAQMCVINKHGRPRKTPADVIGTTGAASPTGDSGPTGSGDEPEPGPSASTDEPVAGPSAVV